MKIYTLESKLEKIIQEIEAILLKNNARIIFGNSLLSVEVDGKVGQLVDTETGQYIPNGISLPREFDTERFKVQGS